LEVTVSISIMFQKISIDSEHKNLLRKSCCSKKEKN